MTLSLQERISNILNNTKAYRELGVLMEDIGLSEDALEHLAYEIEEAIENIIINSEHH